MEFKGMTAQARNDPSTVAKDAKEKHTKSLPVDKTFDIFADKSSIGTARGSKYALITPWISGAWAGMTPKFDNAKPSTVASKGALNFLPHCVRSK